MVVAKQSPNQEQYNNFLAMVHSEKNGKKEVRLCKLFGYSIIGKF